MFTGIITDIGKIKNILKTISGINAEISTSYDLSKVDIGASIACSGICLTVTSKNKNSFSVDVSNETIRCTTINSWCEGTEINLERAMKLGDEFGGHIVSGHVDGTAEIISINNDGNSRKIAVLSPDNLKKYIVAKGSIALDGTSLTVNEVEDNIFYINIIPHTWNNTNFKNLTIGSKINIEVDMLARYVERINYCK